MSSRRSSCPHPVEVRASTHCGGGNTLEPEHGNATAMVAGVRQAPRSVSGGKHFREITLTQWCPLDPALVLRHTARRFKQIERRVSAFKPVYDRRDMLSARLYCALSRAGVTEVKVNDSQIESIAIASDEDTGRTRLVVRSKRGRKAPNGPTD